MAHVWSLSTIVGAIALGVWQRVLEWLHGLYFVGNYISPMQQSGGPPTWWWNGSNWFDWYMHRDSQNTPDRQFIEAWLRSAWNTLGIWVEEVGKWARNEAQSWTRAVTGYALYGWANFSTWINNIGARLGDGMVWWGQNVRDALTKVYDWLPPEIRTYVQSWSDLLNYWIQKAKDWVVATYQMLIAFGALAWSWVSDSGTKLKDWWIAARSLLDEFRANPTKFILDRLGSHWLRLVWFSACLLDWYSALYSLYAGTLNAFLADPSGWIYDKLEVYLERIW
jgi:hypothetical protein